MWLLLQAAAPSPQGTTERIIYKITFGATAENSVLKDTGLSATTFNHRGAEITEGQPCEGLSVLSESLW